MDLVSQRGGYLTLLKKPSFLRLWLAQLISMTIFNAANYALIILIGGDADKGSATQIGIAIICFSLPAVLFGVPAGVVVDHMDKRQVLWGSNCLRAIATLLFVISLIFNRGALLPIYLLTFIISTISQFFTPAEGSSIPLLVNEKELAPALSLFNVTFMLAQALGYVLLAPILIALLPSFTIAHISIDSVILLYIIIGILYLLCALLVATLPKGPFEQQNQQDQQKRRQTGPIDTQTLGAISNVWQEMIQGWSFVRSNKALYLAVIQLSFAGVLILVIGEIATPIVTDLLFLNANAMAFVFAPAGIGLVGGSVLMPRITGYLGKKRTVFSGTLLLAIVAALLPLSTLLAHALQPRGWNTNPLLLLVIALLMLLAGLALAAVNMPALTAMQKLTPDWIKGRVLALQLVLYNAASIPVILFIGAATDIFGIDHVLYILGGCSLAFGLWGLYYEGKIPAQPHAKTTQEQPISEEQEIITPQTH
ncbi:MAG: MFS transporter [Ktedonobacteraceae bacterium]|nr:MFS transporter [Ktedonobacteraceae bacterium]MBO0789809.1 MFS transporter [Ktedonobacteraceae bacterium]